MTLEQQFRSRVREFLARTRISPTRFGRMAMGDPNLLRQIEGGRSLTLRTADRILALVDEIESGGARDPPRRRRGRKRSPPARRTKRSRRTTNRPMNESTNPPTRILRLPEVLARTGMSRTTIYEWMAQERFPRAVPLGARSVGWFESELEAWFRQRSAERPGEPEGAAHLTAGTRRQKV